MQHPNDLPGLWKMDETKSCPEIRAARVRDFVAGMTDRYALEVHASLFDATPELR